MNIATALNKKYLLYTGVMLVSLCENNPEHIDAYLLHSELEEKDITKLKEALENYDITIISLKVDRDQFDDRLPRDAQWSIETYYRLMLLDILPDYVERILYLDVDIIVNKSLKELYNIDFEDREIIAAEDSCGKRTIELFGVKQKSMFSSRFEKGFKYFNAGVMLLNVKKMKKNHNFKTYMNVAAEWEYHMEAPDQDILNYVHWENIGYVDWKKYDMFARIAHNDGYTYQIIKSSTAIVHFAGYKPWEASNCHFDIEQLWWDYAKLTPFYKDLLEEFQKNQMFDDRLEKYMESVFQENSELKDKVKQLFEINQKMLALIGLSH
jgi:lipopolysaccharide biosynthesis glycosyltransferase